MIDDMFEEPVQMPPNLGEKWELFEWIKTRPKEFWEYFNKWGSEGCPKDGETYLWLVEHWN